MIQKKQFCRANISRIIAGSLHFITPPVKEKNSRIETFLNFAFESGKHEQLKNV